ncbi:MAG: hypothetical protein A2315_07750 [Ignavibacteria bacterium RIFOXYB2_FULL_35_12]|nr:MAG: hypothetical protein A2058_01885 [Ignavibacteria bacterium GWA2_36_19]OGU60403.1 MAG: hypothetical protein A2X60_02960 [Ignavibacteria bacterium GWF2_35_20]OGU83159.1 MAG: hypothetical protein A2254_12650 [Ignavibacteria bacterium RIFOXYA2_FULL_35_9]OGU84300.1 MAG: hypothetical protein A3K31_15490 [Ignavibacteria bacterium RIFOXYA12_FULL_35_25]OGU88551.1 MAG: hypothetical protein A2492_03515 [Ignavibacteria bacterium RIFOXYC12_FULL_35_11]OGU95950.1 MAG: hypothetical protein A2347_10050
MSHSKELLNDKNSRSNDLSIFTRNHYINLISCILIWLSGSIFIIKLFEKPAVELILYTVIFPAIIILIERTEKHYKVRLTKNALFLIVLIAAAAAIVLYRLNYIDYPPIAGFLILCLIIFYHAQNVKMSLIQLTVIIFSPVLYSELISFSGLFALSVLTALSIFISDRFLQSIKFDWKFFLVAFLFGVTLSTHLITGCVYLVYLLYAFRNNFSRGFIFILFMLVIYAAVTFLANEGYIAVQVSHAHLLGLIPVWVKILLLILTFYIGWIAADFQEVLFSSGVILFLTFIVSLVFKISQIGWSRNEIDFSLAIIAIPFLVLSIKEYKVDRFLGKVLN